MGEDEEGTGVMFEVFKRSRVRPDLPPAVTIRADGTMALNRAAFKALGSPITLELLYDPARELIGLRAAASDGLHGYRVYHAPGHGPDNPAGTYLAGKAFLDHYRVDRSVTQRYPASIEDGVLCVDRSQPGQVVARERPNGRRKRDKL